VFPNPLKCKHERSNIKESRKRRNTENKKMKWSRNAVAVYGDNRQAHRTPRLIECNECCVKFHSSPNTIRTINSKRIRWIGDIDCLGRKANIRRILVEKTEGKYHKEGLDVDGKILLK
jgi:hypothetical protein